MAVNSEEKNDSPAKQAAAAAAAIRGDERVLGATATDTVKTAGSLLNMNLEYGTGLGSLNSNNYVQRYLDVFKKFLTERLGANNWQGYQLHVLDSQSYQTVVSAIVVTYTAEVGGKRATGFHRILVEKSAGGRLPPIPMPVAGGQTLEIPATIGDVDVMQTSFYEIVSKMLMAKMPGMTLVDAGSTVIPNELEPEDTNRLIRVLFHAIQACTAMANNRVAPDQKIFSLSKIIKSDVLKAGVDNNPKPVETLAGLPIRSDLNATLNVSSGNNNDIATTNSRDIFSVDAFVDLVYAKQQMSPYSAMMMQPGMMQQQYAPRLVITKITNMLFDDYRMEMMLFGLLQSLIFNRNMMWSNVFNRRMKTDDIHDIGALGYDMPSLVSNDPNGRGAKINTKLPTFSDKDLIDLIFRAIRPNLIYSIDIPEADDSSWMLNTFHHCAKNQQAAYDIIYNAANALTDGHFAKHFQKGKAIMVDEDTRIHNGYYQLGDGIRRDIRDYDYLAVLNHYGSSDPGAIAVWSATFDDRVSGNIYERAARRMSMIRDMAPGVVHTGWSQRHTIAPDFLQALHIAADNAGLVVRQGNVLGYNGVQQRGIQNADSLGMQPLQGGIYSHVTMGAGNRGISSGPTWRQG